MIEAWLYDGRSAVKRRALVAPDEGGLRLSAPSGADAFVAAEQLTHVERRPDEEVFGHKEIPGWRLGIPRPIPAEFGHVLPRAHVYGGLIDRIGLAPALIAGGLVSAGLLWMFSQLPEVLAPHVPASWERRFGDALVGDLDDRTCNRREGQAALNKLVAQLTPRHRDLKVRVADLGMVNAVALPGGNIVIFKELLAEAESPDEAAGVIAHEIAHIENRDVTRAMIRHYGFSLLLTGLGGTTGGNVDSLLSASYSREAEGRADRDALAALKRSDISPAPTARFFERLAKDEGTYAEIDGALDYLSTHPPSDDRRRLFHEAAVKGRPYRVSLSDKEWWALQDICWNGKTSKPRRVEKPR